MRVNTVLDLKVLFWIAVIAACLSTKMVVFSCKVCSVTIFCAASVKAKTSAWKTVLCFPNEKNFDLYVSRSAIFYVETRTSSSPV